MPAKKGSQPFSVNLVSDLWPLLPTTNTQGLQIPVGMSFFIKLEMIVVTSMDYIADAAGRVAESAPNCWDKVMFQNAAPDDGKETSHSN